MARPTACRALAAPALTLDDLAGHPLIRMPAGTGIRAAFDQACAARGIAPAIALEASAAGVIADLAARGLGVAILSESMAAGSGPRLAALPIAGCGTTALLALGWKPRPAPVVREFARHCRSAFGLDAPEAGNSKGVLTLANRRHIKAP